MISVFGVRPGRVRNWNGNYCRLKQLPFRRTLSFATVTGGLAGRLLAPGGPPGGGGGGGGPEPPKPGIGGGGGGGGGGAGMLLSLEFGLSCHKNYDISFPIFRTHESEVHFAIEHIEFQVAVVQRNVA